MNLILRPLYHQGNSHGTPWKRGWESLRVDVDAVVKQKSLTSLGLELRPLDRPALYRLRYSAPACEGKRGLI
jgi:hypothetical protein